MSTKTKLKFSSRNVKYFKIFKIYKNLHISNNQFN